MLTEKCKNQEALIADYELQEQEWQELQEEAGVFRQQVEATAEELQHLAKDNERLENEMERMKEKLAEEKKNRERVERVMADASKALRVVLNVSKAKLWQYYLRLSSFSLSDFIFGRC
jgi:uncharacterized protein YpuA (DUF1002 family)